MRCGISLIIVVSAFLSGCQAMPWIKESVPDVPICRHLDEKLTTKVIDGKKFELKRANPACMKAIGEPRCGFCVWTLSDKTQYVGEEWNRLLAVGTKKKKWSTIQAEGLTMPAESQAASKAFAINICEKSGMCSGEDITRVRVKFDALDSVFGH